MVQELAPGQGNQRFKNVLGGLRIHHIHRGKKGAMNFCYAVIRYKDTDIRTHKTATSGVTHRTVFPKLESVVYYQHHFLFACLSFK